MPLLPLLLASLASQGAHAEPLGLPSYKDETVVAIWYEVDRQLTAACRWAGGAAAQGLAPLSCDPLAIGRAQALARAASTRLGPDARLHYLIGLGHRYLNDMTSAKASFQRALTIDETRAEVWMELGEVESNLRNWKEADRAFQQVTTLRPAGDAAYFGWLARAQVAAHQGDADGFEAQLRLALNHGFSFRLIEGQPAWRAFYADPDIRPVLDRLITVYGDPAVLESLSKP